MIGIEACAGSHGAYPNTAVLHGQREQVLQRRQLVPVHCDAVGEASEHLVFPLLGEPGFGDASANFLNCQEALPM